MGEINHLPKAVFEIIPNALLYVLAQGMGKKEIQDEIQKRRRNCLQRGDSNLSS